MKKLKNNINIIDDSKEIDKVLNNGVAEVLPNKKSLKKLMQTKRIRLYLGIDPTGNLLTLGHSVVLRKLQQFANLGHEVILLIGNGTVRIGDPTGKDATRPELTDEQIEKNFKTWKEQAGKILDFSKIEVRHNGDWLDKLTFIDIIKLMAKTTVQQLMERDMFKKRLEEGRPVHGHEIMYPLLQGYDSVAMDVDLEIGGTDQTFNMMMGRTLQKSYNNHEKWVLATPLINGTDGRKMSKSLHNFIALTEKANDMYGKLMSTADDEILIYFKTLTDISPKKISDIKKRMDKGENPMQFKKFLAFTITEMYHDTITAKKAEEHFQKTVQQGKIPENIPEIKLSSNQMTVFELLQICLPKESNSNLRRLLKQGAVEFIGKENNDGSNENIKPNDPNQSLSLSNIMSVRIGKRRFFKLNLKSMTNKINK
ncbi:MAG: tyrosine--tRNA ligase [Patescibacteria group bacterium]